MSRPISLPGRGRLLAVEDVSSGKSHSTIKDAMTSRICPRMSLAVSALFIALVFLSCADSGDSSTQSAGSGSYTLEQLERTIISDLGEKAGAAAVLLALDHGYSIIQITEGAMNTLLSSKGYIVNSLGETLNPAYTPTNQLLSRNFSLSKSEYPVNVFDLVNSADRSGQPFNHGALWVVLLLANKGYSEEQIMYGLLTREVYLDDRFDCDVIIRGPDGTALVPGRPMDAGTLGSPASPSPTNTPTATPTSVPRPGPSDCQTGTFACGNGQLVCAEDVCNNLYDCSDQSDEADSLCGNPGSCCVATQGCPGETGSSCGSGCCCCPYGQACDQGNWQNGCIPAATRMIYDFSDPGKNLREIGN